MADYDMPTVIQPRIPHADMTPLEHLLLTVIFASETDENGIYFFAEQSTNDMPEFEIPELRAALLASEGIDSRANAFVTGELAKTTDDDAWITLDMSIMSWDLLFQDIVKRSPTLTYITAVSAFTCSKMRPDGFGGMAMMVTANWIKSQSTEDIICAFLDDLDAEAGPSGGAQ